MPYTKEETDRYATVDGVKLHYNDVGSGPALLCFHGGGPGANAWDNTRFNVEGLAPHFRMLLVDMPGYGESDKRARRPEGLPGDTALAQLYAGLMDQLGIDQAHFYASSASAIPALRFALDFPQRTGKIVLQANNNPLPRLAYSPTPAEGIKALGEFRAEPTRERMARMMELFVPDPSLLTNDLIDRRFSSAMTPGHLESAGQYGSSPSHLWAEMRGMETETLILWGQQDWMVPVEGAMLSLATIPNSQLHVWAGAGHFVQYEKTDEFNRLVLDFLMR
jgi:pimeloyl-ACP methyl ester carboxylesterase